MIYQKYERLQEILASYQKILIAFSGGVDSSFLLKVAYDVLGANALGITASTPYIAQWEIDDAISIAREIGVSHDVVTLPWIEAIHSNPHNRCYLCKHALFSSFQKSAQEKGFSVIAEGSNVDDTKEYRPGRVALGELGIVTPLLEANLTKDEIRALSKELGLRTWHKPSYACLLTRFPYDRVMSQKELQMVGTAEAYLIEIGYADMRVRYENGIARIEMPFTCKIAMMNDPRLDTICEHLKSLGFLHVTLDLEAYRHDSMRESMQQVEGN